jgi:prepilin-type N-terminal cleavage/methylation domain-containing protein/prepilin-type processing-associated H-X9-DG protein
MFKARKFTLIELLVVIAIIGILVSMLLPSLNSVREKGKSIACIGNLKNIAIAFQSYLGDSGGGVFQMNPVTPSSDAGNPGNWGGAKDGVTCGYQDLLPATRRPMTDYLGLNSKVFMCPSDSPNTLPGSVMTPGTLFDFYGTTYGMTLGFWVAPGGGSGVSFASSGWPNCLTNISQVRHPTQLLCIGETTQYAVCGWWPALTRTYHDPDGFRSTISFFDGHVGFPNLNQRVTPADGSYRWLDTD